MNARSILAIDTATPEAAVALRLGGTVAERPLAWRSSFRQAVPAIESLLDEARSAWEDLEGIAIPGGPGSFTGLRIGASIAIAIADLRGLSLYAPPTLAAVAEGCAPAGADRVCASLDARRGRRYAAILERDGPGAWCTTAGPFDLEPGEVAVVAGGAPIVSLEDARSGRLSPAAALTSLAASAGHLYRLASPERLELVYARAGVSPR